MTKLFEKRMDIAKEVAKYKIKTNTPLFDKKREEIVIKRNADRLKNDSYRFYLENFYVNLMNISKEIQHNLIKKSKVKSSLESDQTKIGYLGIPGSFSYEALLNYSPDCIKIPYSTFREIYDAIDNKLIDFGIIPIENSSSGQIKDSTDLLREYGFFIIDEELIKIEHNLLGVKDSSISDIKYIYSHPQGFEQSSHFLTSLGDIELVPYKSTAESAKLVKEKNDKTIACIASKEAASIYELDVLKEHINHSISNYTRFVVIGRKEPINDKNNKISLILTTDDTPGALLEVLSIFKENGVNLMKIESRPIPDKSWQYFFYIDFEGNINDKNIKSTLKLLEEKCEYFRYLGNYEKVES